MMKNKENKQLIIISVAFYAAAVLMMAIGTFYDLEIDKALFNPQSSFVIYLEAFGQSVYWGMWGPIFTVLLLENHSLDHLLKLIGCFLPFVKTEFDKESKAYKTAGFLAQKFLDVLFFVLAVVGWRKLVANVLNDFFDWSEVIYYLISVGVAVIGVLAFSRLDKETIRKLEYLAVAGIALGILFKITEELKTIMNRIRFREMVAFSNGIVDENGMSNAKTVMLHSPLTCEMAENTDFSAFSPWYKIGTGSDIYSHTDSFPSGHTTNSCAIFLSFLFAKAFEKLRKFTPILLAFSFLYVAAMGLSRMMAGAHFLTDVVFGAIVGYTSVLVAFLILRTVQAKIENKNI
ncbi:MAG: phosphatase PAP2 family protein [Acutalibacteraceae bacterium]